MFGAFTKNELKQWIKELDDNKRQFTQPIIIT